MLNRLLLIALAASFAVGSGCSPEQKAPAEPAAEPIHPSKRLVVDLNGTWEIARLDGFGSGEF